MEVKPHDQEEQKVVWNCPWRLNKNRSWRLSLSLRSSHRKQTTLC